MGIIEEILGKTSVKDFYEGFGLRLTEVGTNDYKTTCPFHDDNNPSLTIHRDTGVFKCHATTCGASGHLLHFYARFHKISLSEANIKLTEEYIASETKKDTRSVPDKVVEELHTNLLESPGIIKALQEGWALNAGTIREYKLGYKKGYVAIPIPDATRRNWLNIQYHRLIPGPRKIFSYRDEKGQGFGSNVLYPISALVGSANDSRLFFAPGPKDCLALRQRGFNAVSTINGEGSFEDDWLSFFEGRRVTICFDNDEGGRTGALKVALKLALVTGEISILNWGNAVAEGQDLTDFFLRHNVDEFVALLNHATPYVPDPSKVLKPILPTLATLDHGLPAVFESITNFLRGVTDAPKAYLSAAAIMCLAGALSDLILISPDRLHPNLWTLLLGRTARYRKTTILRLVGEILNKTGVKVLPGYFTSEGLISEMGEGESVYAGPVIWLKDEFAGILGEFRKDYQASTKEVLMELYDTGTLTRVLSKRKIKVANIQFSLFSAGIPERLSSMLREEEIFSGFINRFLMFYPEKKEIERPYMLPLSMSELESVSLELLDLRNFYRDRVWSVPYDGKWFINSNESKLHYAAVNPKAQQTVRSYLMDMHLVTKEDVAKQALMERAEIQIIKISSLLAAARKRVWANVITITNRDVGEAITLYDNVRDSMFRFFFGDSGDMALVDATLDTPMDKKFSRAIRLISEQKKIMRGKLMQKTQMSAREMGQFIETIKMRGDVVAVQTNSGQYFMWRGS